MKGDNCASLTGLLCRLHQTIMSVKQKAYRWLMGAGGVLTAVVDVIFCNDLTDGMLGGVVCISHSLVFGLNGTVFRPRP